MKAERLAEIRALATKGAPWGYADIAAIIGGAGELLAHIDDLTRQLDDARRLALPAFISPEGDLSEHTHVLDGWASLVAALGARKACPAATTHGTDCSLACTQSNESGQVGSRYGPPVTGNAYADPDRAHDDISPPSRPSAYDMPVGSVVRTDSEKFVRKTIDPGGWSRDLGKTGIQSGWIEGLFSDGLVTEWRLP